MKRLADGPGPGAYAQLKPQKPDIRELRSELQFFGSTTERFKKEPGQKSAVPDKLGPGSYVQIHRKAEGPNARGFCATQQRFKVDDAKIDIGPGPGQYEAAGMTDDGMNGPLATFSMLGSCGGLAFGTMSKRSTYGSDDAPGPGSYPIPGMSDDACGQGFMEEYDSRGSPGRARKVFHARPPCAAFASRTPKDVGTKGIVKDGLQKPPPGAYDPVLIKDQATVVRLRAKSEGFLSAANRFAGGPLDAPKGYKLDTGPGKYSPQAVTGGKRDGTFNRSICEGMPESGRANSLGFDSQDRRFNHTTSGELGKGPGPGTYRTNNSWIKKSHNCYFGE
jgi:hypothetical protein